MLVEVNKTYNCFDDGKIRESRRSLATITDIIPFAEIDTETLKFWREEVKECPFLYAKETDYFMEGTLEDKTQVVFVRTLNDGWFSLGDQGGRLDIDGSLTQLLEN